MQWNVFRYDINSRKIELYNIFKHSGFAKDIQELLSKQISKEEFAEELHRSAMYYFWSRCEYEIAITSWPPYIDRHGLDVLNFENENYHQAYGHYPNCLHVDLNVEKKIDIFEQIRLNWDAFVDYVWGQRKQPYGKWELSDTSDMPVFECSNCKRRLSHSEGAYVYKFCPHCGIPMIRKGDAKK